MKNKILFSLILIFSFLFTFTEVQAQQNSCSPAQTGTLVVSVTGIKNNDGVVRISLFNSKKKYVLSHFTADYAYKKAILKITNNQAEWKLDNLPYGLYIIMLYHDEDNSGKFKTNFLGIPKEGFGFSNNPVLKHKPPSVNQISFYLDSKYKKIEIRMINKVSL